MASYASSLMNRAGAHLLRRVSAERDDSGQMLKATVKPLGGGPDIETSYIVAPPSVEERVDQFGERETKTNYAEKVLHLSMADRLGDILKNWAVVIDGATWPVEEVRSVNETWAVVVVRRVTDRVNRTPRA
jgi:hypothetical protein